eukprot:7636716-Pyramimonas_sp.AAC.1
MGRPSISPKLQIKLRRMYAQAFSRPICAAREEKPAPTIASSPIMARQTARSLLRPGAAQT